MKRPAPGTPLCRVDDLGNPGAKGFTFGSGRDYFSIFVVKSGAKVFGYVNECPHAYTTLDYPDDRFLTTLGDEIICGTHGARFTIESGRCTLGPCKGRSLTPFPIEIAGGEIRVGTDGHAALIKS